MVCTVHSTQLVNHTEHIEGKAHKLQIQRRSPFSFKVKSISKLEKHTEFVSNKFQCNEIDCDSSFYDTGLLKVHTRAVHGILIECSECVLQRKFPVPEFLTCSELVDHYKTIHNKNVDENDLKTLGQVKNWKQGIIQCKLCPKPKLGNIGLWFGNELPEMKIKDHFIKNHNSHLHHWLRQITVGCQLCSFKVPGEKFLLWNIHLPVHELEAPESSHRGKKVPPGVLSYCCSYCGDQVPCNSQSQVHNAKYHLLQAFVCKLCQSGSYLYRTFDDVQIHLKQKHGVLKFKVSHLDHIVFPGDKDNLLDFAWVQCKRCNFNAVGLDRKTIGHQESSHSGGGLEHFMIYCRLCHKEYKPSQCPFDDPEDFRKHMLSHHSNIVKVLHDP